MNKKIIYGGLSIILIVLAFVFSSYLIGAKPEPEKDNLKQNSVFVKAEKVSLIETESNMTYRGRVTAFDKVSLAAEVQGKIMQGDVRFKAGESFNKNDVLITIYSKDVEAALKSGKSSFLQTLSKILPDLKVDYSNEYEKWNNFFTAIDVEKPLPKLPEISSNKEKVFLAANNVLTSYYSLQQQEINIQKYVITAPFKGSFQTVNKEIGAVASPGAELASIIRSDILEVTVPVFPSDLKWAHIGEKVKITNQLGEVKTASISRISDFINEATQSVDVYLTFQSSSKSRFLQGEYVDVAFNGGVLTGFKIPREALVATNSVYELVDKKLVKVQVEILRQLDDSYIISGLREGKVIVTESLASVSENIDYLAR